MKHLVAAWVLLAGVSVCSGGVYFVDDDAPLGGDGATWNTAFGFLQDALAMAVAGDEIHVAQGLYKPDQDELGHVTPLNTEETFQVISGVQLYGGYAGIAVRRRSR